MKIKRLVMSHFKGATASYEFPEQGLQFVGKTGAGKTTVLEAITFCLFGKGLSREELKPKPLDEHNEPILCETEVELTTDKGTFKRIFKEKWTISRGKVNPEKSGHETSYYYDDLPVPAREFNEKVTSIFTEEQFYMTAIPTYFGSDLINWKDRRRILSLLFEQPSDEEMLRVEPELSEILDGSPNETFEKRLAQQKVYLKEINKDRNSLPDRIDELQRLIREVEPKDVLEQELKRLQDGKNKAAAGLDTGKIKQQEELVGKESRLRSEKTEKLRALQETYSKVFDEMDRKYGELSRILRQKDSELRRIQAESRQKVEQSEDNIRKAERKLKISSENADLYMEAITTKHKELERLEEQIDNLTLGTDTCPTCGQKLPPEYVEKELLNAKGEMQIQAMNRGKEINKLQEEQTNAAKDYDDTKLLLEKLHAMKEEFSVGYDEAEHQQISEKMNKLRDEQATVQKKFRDELQQKADEISGTYEVMINGVKEQWEELSKQIQVGPDNALIDAEIELINEKINHAKNNEDYERRIAKLESDKAVLANHAEECLRTIYLYELRLKTAAKIIESQLNSKFKIARFKLFHIQVNTEIQEVCDVLYNGKTTMSTGEAIYVGTDIAETLAKNWEIDPPLLVDGMQNITLDLLSDRQQILTRTTKDDKLKVEEL